MVRIRNSRREKPAAPAAATHDIDFGHLWRQLRAAGWKSKRPSGLQTEWSYSSPDNTHVFVGEKSVVDYAFDSGLLEEADADAQVRDEEGGELDQAGAGSSGEEQQHEGEDVVRPSQIDTSVLLSQHTIDRMFGTPSDDDIELSQTAVSRAFNLSSENLQDGGAREAAAGLHLLSEASGLESEGDVDEEEAAASQPRRRTLTPLSGKEDVNVLLDGEKPSDYENYSSGDSDDDGMSDINSDSGAGMSEEDDDVLSDSDAVEMDKAFIAALQVGNNALSRTAATEREQTLRGMQWTPVSSEYETDAAAYPGLGTEEARPVPDLLQLWRSPILTFFYFMPKSLWVSIAAETNRYGLQQAGKRARNIQARQTDLRRETIKQITRRLKAKAAYSTHEILHVVGLLVARMLCPQKKRFGAHWSMVEDGAVPAGLFGRFMTRDRCQSIMRDLHFVDNTIDHGNDKLWKLRPVVDKVQERFLLGWSLSAIFSFDEGILPSTSKRNTTRMFMADKPHRYGSKLFMVCDAQTAYCHRYV